MQVTGAAAVPPACYRGRDAALGLNAVRVFRFACPIVRIGGQCPCVLVQPSPSSKPSTLLTTRSANEGSVANWVS